MYRYVRTRQELSQSSRALARRPGANTAFGRNLFASELNETEIAKNGREARKRVTTQRTQIYAINTFTVRIASSTRSRF